MKEPEVRLRPSYRDTDETWHAKGSLDGTVKLREDGEARDLACLIPSSDLPWHVHGQRGSERLGGI